MMNFKVFFQKYIDFCVTITRYFLRVRHIYLLESKTDGKNVTINYEYDVRKRLKKVLYPGSEYVEYTYDNNGNRLTMKDTRMDIGDETFTWEYDDVNRVTKEIYPNDDYLTYTYTVGGRRSEMRLPNESLQSYSYDTRGRLSSITHSLGNKTFNYYYNTDNTLSSISYPNNCTNEFTYDNLYRIDTLKASDAADHIYEIDYTYDDMGNRTKAEWDSNRGVSTFDYTKIYDYDDIYQLTSEKKMNQAESSRLYEYQYQFDDAGNRTQMKYYDGSSTETTTYTYNDLNQLTRRSFNFGEVSYHDYDYDDNGNMVSQEDDCGMPIRDFSWNDNNRLESVDKLQSTVAEYTYDPYGRRIMRKDVDNNTYTFYYYDGLTVVAEKEKVGAGSWSWDRIFTVSPGVIGNIFRISTKSGESWTDKYYHYDAIGNVALVTDSSANVDSSIDQEAYGNVEVGSQSGYHLTTKEYDSIGDLYYFGLRWYDPGIGRFISKDPIKQGINHYIFCNNNPVNNIDPTGGCKKKIPTSVKKLLDELALAIPNEITSSYLGKVCREIIDHPEKLNGTKWDKFDNVDCYSCCIDLVDYLASRLGPFSSEWGSGCMDSCEECKKGKP